MIKVTVQGLNTQQILEAAGVTPAATDRALKIASQVAYGDILSRVFNEQGATLQNGQKAPQYSPEYLAYRQNYLRRNNSTVNFTATGSMLRNVKLERRGVNQYVIGLSETGNQAMPLPKQRKKERKPRPVVSNSKKYQGLSDRFGPFLEMTTQELDKFTAILTAELRKAK